MPTVEWAGTPVVSRPTPASRDLPESHADLFAAFFDSARGLADTRVDRVIEQGRQTLDRAGAGQRSVENRAQTPNHREVERLGHSRLAEPQTAKERASLAEDSKKRVGGGDDASRSAEQVSEPSPDSSAATDPQHRGDLDQPAPEDSSQDQQPGEDQSRAQPAHPDAPERPSDRPEASAQPAEPREDSPNPASTQPQSTVGQGPQTTAPPDPVEQAPLSDPGPPSDAPSSAQPVQAMLLGGWQFIGNVAAGVAQFLRPPTQPQNASTPSIGTSVPGQSGASVESPTSGPAVSGAAVVSPPSLPGDGSPGKESAKDAARHKDGLPEVGNEGEKSAKTAAPASDFQNLIEAAGRVRRQLESSQPQSAGPAVGRDLNGRGVNLSEADAVNDLAQVVRSNLGNRHSSMILRLDPPELGQLRIDVRMHDQALTLKVQADTVAGHDALQSRLSDLRTALEQHGFRLNHLEVQLRQPAAPASDSHNARNDQQGSPQWNGSASPGPGWGSHPEGGGPSGESGHSNEPTAPSPDAAFSGDQEHAENERLAETGVDLVV
jgi:flagellar hook-length control protein FliK